MKLLVIGGGGREHAIIKKLKENPTVECIYALPGNGGMAKDAVCTGISATDLDGIVAFAQENGFYKKGKGTLSSLMKEGAEKLGLVSAELEAKQESLAAALNEGKTVICLMDKGKLSFSVHYVVLRECKDGKIYINDPTSVVNSEKEWLFEDVGAYIKKAWAISK